VEDLSPVPVDEVGGMAVEQTVEPLGEPAAPVEEPKPEQETPPSVEPASEEPDEAVPSPS
ncbi:MAG TPA: hypothetical protein VF683_04060, partial [Chthoniobacterales bacterium]